MVVVREKQEVKISLNVRVFKWNEELHNVGSSQGLLLVCVNHNPKLQETGLTWFDLATLSNQDSIRELVSDAIKSRGDCLDETTAKLREAVCEYLLGCFAFHIQPSSSSPRKPTLVIVVDVDVSKRTDGTRKRHLPSGFPPDRQETTDYRDHDLTEDTHDDDASTSSKSVKKRRVGDAVAYKKAIRSRMQQRKLPDQEQNKLRGILRSSLEEPEASTIIPIVAGEPKGLSQVEVAVKEREFYGRESEDVCSICLDGISTGMRVAQSPCSHIFHRACLFRWLPRDSRCPMCRDICATSVQL